MSVKAHVAIVFGIDLSGNATACRKLRALDEGTDGCEVLRRSADGAPLTVVYAAASYREVFDGYDIAEAVVDLKALTSMETVEERRVHDGHYEAPEAFCEKHGLRFSDRRGSRCGWMLVTGWS